MLAVDTSLIVRYLTRDDADQFARAVAVMEGAGIIISTTVLLETEWVLRSGYHYGPRQIVDAFRALAGLPGVALEDAASARQALDWVERGMDFADALRLAKAQAYEAFITFDKRLIATAANLSPVPVRLP